MASVALRRRPAPRRDRIGWSFYEWASSAYSTSVASVFFGPYLTGLADAAADGDGRVAVLGWPLHSGALFPLVVSLAVALQVVLLPLVGALADRAARPKRLLAAAALGGAALTVAMYGLGQRDYALGALLFVASTVAYGAASALFNAYLPGIARGDEDGLSAFGAAMSALGGGVLLAVSLVLFATAGERGASEDETVRLCLALAGLWWALFTLVPLRLMPERATAARRPGDPAAWPSPPPAPARPTGDSSGDGTVTAPGTLSSTRPAPGSAGVGPARPLGVGAALRELRTHPPALLFLIGVALYSDGVGAVTGLASQFGHGELGLPLETLTVAVLVVQFVAFAGAWLCGLAARRAGARAVLAVVLAGWIGAMLYAAGPLRDATGFVGLAAVIGLLLGGTVALTRSLYSRAIPPGREAFYFGILAVFAGGTSWLGPLLFGVALQATGSYRVAILSLAPFFGAGLLLLLRSRLERSWSDRPV